jgi:peptidoglycan/LPS O-acetylase OafA/YrhL
LQYVRQLDGLRAVAVSIVLFHHWIPQTYQPVNHLGRLGVLLFFVLSGFLITGILLQCRELVQSGVESRGFELKQFYVRRFLRIFPVYYTILIIGWLLNTHVIRETMLWHVTYLSNVYLAMRGDWHGSISHLWSLAVEEQFYLFWPALILFLPSRLMLRTIVGLILVAPLFRGIGSLLGLNPVAAWVLGPACLDTLGMGALLALVRHSPEQIPVSLRNKSGWLPWIGLILLGGTVAEGQVNGDTPLYLALYDSGAALVAVSLVAKASLGIPGNLGTVLEWRPIAYLGKISYGVYLLHLFVSSAINRVVHQWVDPHDPRYAIPLIIGYLVTTVALASLSWRFLEAPLNELKRFFPYRRPTR